MPQLLLVRKQEAVEPRQTLKATVHQCLPSLVSYQHYAEDHPVLLMYVNMPATVSDLQQFLLEIVVLGFLLHVYQRTNVYMDHKIVLMIHRIQ